jgi:hypothetical protein
VYVADSTTDAAFNQVASRITDGLDQFVRLVMVESTSGRAEQRGWRESGFFLGHGTTEEPDLQGAQVNAVQLRVDGFRLASSGAASLPPVELQLTLSVMGVPEPSSLAQAAAGLAMIAGSVYTVAARRRRSA